MPIATDDGSTLTGNPINDCYGSKTETAGTAITRVIAPRPGGKAVISSFQYSTAGTEHTITIMTTLADKTVSSDAAASQAVVSLNAIPVAPDGSVLAANDFLVLQYEDGTWNAHKVSSLSGLDVTLTANLSKKVLKGTRAFFMGAPADHADRQFKVAASKDMTFADAAVGVGSSSRTGEPIMIQSDNATAAGNLRHVAYKYV